MWLFFAFMSAVLLGCYDSFKKQALKGHAVIPSYHLQFFKLLHLFLRLCPAVDR